MTQAAYPVRRARSTALRLGYPVLSGFFRARGWESLRTQPAVLVYQMAKVGSQTVVRSIRGSQPGQPVFHVHTLTADGMAAMDAFYRWSRVPALPVGGHLLVSRFLEEQIRRGVTPGRWKVITLVRDPVARNISLLFQLGRRLLPDFRARCDTGRLDLVSLIEECRTAFPSQVDCMRWFRSELYRVFGVDVYGSPFDRERGCQVYPGRTVDVLLIKTEHLDRCGAGALRSFLGLESLRWQPTNIRAHKTNGGRYVRLLQNIELPTEFVDRCYDSSEVRHFYTDAELAGFRSRWCGTRGGAG